MKELSQHTKLPQSGIRRMFDLAKGRPGVVSFVLGEPDFVTPRHIIESAKAKLDEGRTHYTDNAGILPLREAVSESLERLDRVKYDPTDEIQVTVGGMQGVYLAMLVLLNPGDEVLIADPSYTNYVGQVEMNYGKAVPVPVYQEDGFNFTEKALREKLTPKTKAILLNSPCNPTGGVAGLDTLKMVADFACENDLYVVYDAVYKRLIYDGAEYVNVASLPGMRGRTIYVDSFSKTYAMTGWRLGYMAGPSEIISLIPKLQENVASCLPEFIQWAGIEALRNGDGDVERMNAEYAKRRDLLMSMIDDTPNVSCVRPKGAFYAFVNVKKTGMSSVEFAEMLLEKKGVVVAPGSAFGRACEGFVRISYATSIENVTEGMSRIQEFIKGL